MAARFFCSCGRGCCFFLLLLLGFFPTSSHSQSAPAVYVSGDSLTDFGNNNYLVLSPLKANFPHNGIDYTLRIPTGRFSNGKNLADFLAEKLGLATSPPYLSLSSFATDAYLNGVSFASGGAGILNTTHKGQCLTFDMQIEYFKKVRAGLQQKLGDVELTKHLSRSIFVVEIGGDDYLGYSESGSSDGARVTLQQFVDELILKLKGQLRTIYDLGARKVAFIGTFPIGCTPLLRASSQNGDCDVEANNWSKMYNAGVRSLLQEMTTTLSGFKYTFCDANAAFMQILSIPSSYGFTELKAACCGRGKLNAELPCLPVAAYCSKREAYVSWDFDHRTQALSGKLMDKYFDVSASVVYPLNIHQLPCFLVAAYCSNREAYLFWDFVHPTQALVGKLMEKYFEGSSPVVYPFNIRQLASLAV